MGIYLGQLPPAEIARFKNELAETLIANFCYPRFFDYRTQTLHTRPVDRAKRQEVWLYLSAIDFTVWSRVDLMSADLQLQIERLLIQFVQRNRSFFGNQGRRRMSDIRMLISACATNVAQGLRNHLTGQRASNPPFGSPRPVVSWGANPISGRPSLAWDQISTSSTALQQQLQETRGEQKAAAVAVADRHQNQVSAANEKNENTGRRAVPARPLPGGSASHSTRNDFESAPAQQAGMPTRSSVALTDDKNGGAMAPAAASRRSEHPVASAEPAVARKSGHLAPGMGTSVAEPPVVRKADATQPAISATAAPPAKAPTTTGRGRTTPLHDNPGVTTAPSPQTGRSASATAIAPNGATTSTRDTLSVGEDDIAIFEQMRHQLVLWLRIEAITAGLEINGQGPAQLLELLRQQARLDETRLQVVSTLLNLANQVIKTGMVSVLDYKQALMFHLMHTRRV